MSKTVRLRNISPLGYLNVPLIGREGDAPYFAPCERCDPQHPEIHDDELHTHHELVDEHLGEPGSGCLVPGEEFDVSAEDAEQLLAQEGNFELVVPKKPPAKKAAAKKTAAAPPADRTETPEG